VEAKLCLERPIWPRLPKKGVTQWWGRPIAFRLIIKILYKVDFGGIIIFTGVGSETRMAQQSNV